MKGRRRPPPLPSLWLVVLVLGLTVGAAAVFLSGAFMAPNSPSGSGPATLTEPAGQSVAWLLEILPIALIGFFIFERLRQGSSPVPTRLVAQVLLVIVLLIIFVIFVRVNLFGPTGPTSLVHAGQNATTNGTGPTGGNQTTVNATGPGDLVNLVGIPLPSWEAIAIVAAIVVVVGSLAAFFVLRRAAGGARLGGPPSAAGVRSELESAARALDDGTGDPRHILIALYGRLLRRLEPRVGDLTTSTPGEIRTHCLIRLGVQPATAAEVTRLFELACYSSHPIGPAEVVRARQVLNAAVADLNRPRAS